MTSGDISKLDLQPGDIFLSYNPWFIGKLILWAEKLWSNDDIANYGHGGIILNPEGKTFEALWRLRHSTINKYINGRLLIARPEYNKNKQLIPIDEKLKAIKELEDEYLGDRYPVHRLLLHIIPPLAKYLSTGKYVVCTELVAKYLARINVRHGQWAGTNPDHLADEIKNHKYYTIIYEKGNNNGS